MDRGFWLTLGRALRSARRRRVVVEGTFEVSVVTPEEDGDQEELTLVVVAHGPAHCLALRRRLGPDFAPTHREVAEAYPATDGGALREAGPERDDVH